MSNRIVQVADILERLRSGPKSLEALLTEGEPMKFEGIGKSLGWLEGNDWIVREGEGETAVYSLTDCGRAFLDKCDAPVVEDAAKVLGPDAFVSGETANSVQGLQGTVPHKALRNYVVIAALLWVIFILVRRYAPEIEVSVSFFAIGNLLAIALNTLLLKYLYQ